MKDNSYELCEEDRDFVASILQKYSQQIKLIKNEIVDGKVGAALSNLEKRAAQLSEQINPIIYDHSMRFPRLIIGLKYPLSNSEK